MLRHCLKKAMKINFPLGIIKAIHANDSVSNNKRPGSPLESHKNQKKKKSDPQKELKFAAIQSQLSNYLGSYGAIFNADRRLKCFL